MSQDNTQIANSSLEQPTIEKVVAQEVATESQNKESQPSTEVGDLIAESKKYRARAQVAEDRIKKMEKKIADKIETQLVEQNKWQELAEQRGSTLKEQGPVIEAAMSEINNIREELLADFNEEDKETFESLNLSQLRTIHKKIHLNNEKVTPTDSTPARASNPTNKDWRTMSTEDRRSNWEQIVGGYKQKK
tara:strand:+ start:3227 stop:3799 length:573 start_codon:yes stop_codon:yes gene_type:complete